MQFRDYWRVLVKRWWIIVLVAAIASLTAYGYSKLQRPIFRSTVYLRIEPGRPDWGLTLVGQAIMRQYAAMLQTSIILERVNGRLQLDLTPPQLRSMVKVASIPDDMRLQIDVDHPDPGTARRIARELAQAFVEDQEQRMTHQEPRDRVNVFLFDEPTPGELERPKTRMNVLAGAVLGLVVGGLLVFLLEFLDDTIKTAEDVERWVNLPAIGTIPQIAAADTRRTQPDSPPRAKVIELTRR
ncbi:MAG: lipopolysaccharide biosynthesis protein [Chloroflexi bacterium]|nr:lipopolysaccharide biosynthesis protein [Chloroflexota bacterium]